MDAYFQDVAIQQRFKQEYPNNIVQSLSHTDSQHNPLQNKVTINDESRFHLGYQQEYFNSGNRWKDQEQAMMLPNIHEPNISFNNPNELQKEQHQQGVDFDFLAAADVASRSFSVGMQHAVMLKKENSVVPTQELSQYSSQASAILSQHQILDSQQELVMTANHDRQDENFNTQIVSAFLWIEAKLCAQLKYLHFCERVSYIYNPLEYASDPHAHYVSKFCGTKPILFLGMNPGPYGMVQNGVPFGDTRFVKEWLRVSGDVQSPLNEHPRRLIQGFKCTRSEVSGARFWGFMAKFCGTPEQFFRKCFVHNYCPLAFMTKTGKNVIPAALPASDRRPLEAACDSALLQVVRVLRCQVIVAIGKYAADRAHHVLKQSGDESSASIRVERILHPSPASPQANSGWEEIAVRQLQACGVLQYLQMSI